MRAKIVAAIFIAITAVACVATLLTAGQAGGEGAASKNGRFQGAVDSEVVWLTDALSQDPGLCKSRDEQSSARDIAYCREAIGKQLP